jgi:IPT/TIG domain
MGGTTIAIAGTNFVPGATVNIGGQPAMVLGITPAQIVVRTPPGIEGYAHVTVVEGSQTLSLTQAFSYAALRFTDETLTVAVTRLKAVHITDLRDAINALRGTVSLPAAAFTDPSLAGTRIRGAHLLELRTALDQARAALGRSALTYANPLTPGSIIRAIDVLELRNGVR